MQQKTMQKIATQKFLAVATLLFAASTLNGCHIDDEKHGDNKNLKIATPFGGMQVKTNNADVLAGIGLPTYPGAVAIRKNKSNGDDGGNSDNGAADINMSFGSFQLKVKAIDYRTDDSTQKVYDFYKKALGRYGNVIQCRNDHPVGTPTRTTEGLTCEDNQNSRDNDHHNSGGDDNSSDASPRSNHAPDDHTSKDGVSPFNGSAKIQLKAGSRKHQHIVDINPDGSGTKFGLVSLDLPTDFSFGDKSDKDKDESKQ